MSDKEKSGILNLYINTKCDITKNMIKEYIMDISGHKDPIQYFDYILMRHKMEIERCFSHFIIYSFRNEFIKKIKSIDNESLFDDFHFSKTNFESPIVYNKIFNEKDFNCNNYYFIIDDIIEKINSKDIKKSEKHCSYKFEIFKGFNTKRHLSFRFNGANYQLFMYHSDECVVYIKVYLEIE